MSWTALQREALEAMGVQVLQPLGAAPAYGAQPGRDAAQAAPEVANRPQAATAPVMQAGLAEASPAADRLLRALLRAAGYAPDAADWAELASQWPPADRLRRDPAAKRALWPRLRALRRARG